ncbi:unnamed protein product [Amoebophrya sp. A120]|nr:unnamed protein product [Amoebophrya sp. A120]|eukprot:GSA120T00014077001.1
MEHDPLILRGNAELQRRKSPTKGDAAARQKLEGSSGGAFRVDDLLQFLFPAVQFMLGLGLTSYPSAEYVVSYTVVLVALFSFDIMFLLLIQQQWVREMSVLALFSLLTGIGIGSFFIYSNYFVFYTGYDDLRAFTNVIATQDPKTFIDASMLSFAFSSSVDISRSVGFKSFEEDGKMYCVAPITDSSMALSSPVHFWAVGQDCCESRSHFTCGDVHNAKAHAVQFIAGVVVLRPEMFVPPMASWIVEKQDKLLEQYSRAVTLAQNVFGIAETAEDPSITPAQGTTSSDTPASKSGAIIPTTSDDQKHMKHVFVHWTLTPLKTKSAYKSAADAWFSFITIFGLIFLYYLAYYGFGLTGGGNGSDSRASTSSKNKHLHSLSPPSSSPMKSAVGDFR